jgi:predicted transcriptional regulator
MRKIISKILRKRGYRKYSIAELKTMNIGIVITQEYITSRKFRRIMNESEIGSFIKDTLSEWEKLNNE